MKTKHINRRSFISKSLTTLGAFAAPTIIPSSVLGKNGSIAPSNRVTLGFIGIGWMGGWNLENLLKEKDAHVVAVSDVDKNHLNDARNMVNSTYGNHDCSVYNDYREMIARKDIDGVCISLPDHWHAIAAIDTLKSGKDVWGEKPFSHSLLEGRAMCNAVKKYNRIWQTGSWQRSEAHFRFACELVRNGRIGKVHTVQVGLPYGHDDYTHMLHRSQPEFPPDYLDYDRWLGPAPYKPYCPPKLHKNWRWFYDYGGGMLMDWIGHHGDIGLWGMDMEYTGPITIEGHGEFPKTGLFETATKYWVEEIFENGLKMEIAGGYPEIKSGTKFIGTDGWVWVDRSGMETYPAHLAKEKIGPEEIHLYKSPGHWRNFVDCIKSRKTSITPSEAAHRSASLGHLGLISMLTGRKINFDPVSEKIINDETASSLLGATCRSPWNY